MFDFVSATFVTKDVGMVGWRTWRFIICRKRILNFPPLSEEVQFPSAQLTIFRLDSVQEVSQGKHLEVCQAKTLEICRFCPNAERNLKCCPFAKWQCFGVHSVWERKRIGPCSVLHGRASESFPQRMSMFFYSTAPIARRCATSVRPAKWWLGSCSARLLCNSCSCIFSSRVGTCIYQAVGGFTAAAYFHSRRVYLPVY